MMITGPKKPDEPEQEEQDCESDDDLDPKTEDAIWREAFGDPPSEQQQQAAA